MCVPGRTHPSRFSRSAPSRKDSCSKLAFAYRQHESTSGYGGRTSICSKSPDSAARNRPLNSMRARAARCIVTHIPSTAWSPILRGGIAPHHATLGGGGCIDRQKAQSRHGLFAPAHATGNCGHRVQRPTQRPGGQAQHAACSNTTRHNLIPPASPVPQSPALTLARRPLSRVLGLPVTPAESRKGPV